MKTSEILIAGAVVIGVVGVIYYLTSQPKTATTTTPANPAMREPPCRTMLRHATAGPCR